MAKSSGTPGPNDPAPIRYGMVGGGQDAFIGAVHRTAALLDGQFALVAGALSSKPAKAHASAAALGLDPERSYGSYIEMAAAESSRVDGIEAVVIVTPNDVHYPASKAFLEAGIHVICDKPMTTTLADAKKLAKLVEKSGKLFVLTHNYSGYPMVRQAREMVETGVLGEIRVVQAEYPQGWLTERLEKTGHKQAAWRTDPKRSGAGGCVGDIGTHAYHLASFVTGLETESLSADLDSFVEGRPLDDNVHVMLRYKGGAKGMLWASQVAPNHENGLRLRVYGTKGGLEWVQADPNYLWHRPHGDNARLLTRGGANSGASANRVTRVPAGHPEGYQEGFANLYAEAARAIRAMRRKNGKPPKDVLYPTVEDGVAGMAFIEACIRSSKKNGSWVKL